MLTFAFFFVLTLTLFMPALIPSLHLMFFAPFLIFSYYKKSFFACLWLSILCGVILDLLAPGYRLGLHALAFTLTSMMIYNQKQNFFEDSLTTIPIMTFFFSSISTIILTFLLYLFEKGIDITWAWVGTDLVVMPLFDACYGFVCFTLPRLAFSTGMTKSGEDYFQRRRL